ncbi:MAG: hypothetical protein IRY99_10440 [Isosphaeraceae bacterium]|nr:hypothetical protein [Isosphaeraceae bacterium]
MIEEPAARAAMLTEIAAALARAGHTAEALRTAERIAILSEREPALLRIALIQAEAGDISGALQTVARTSEDSYSNQHLVPWVQARAGDLDGARRMAVGIGLVPERARAWEGIAMAQLVSGDTQGALETAGAVSEAGIKLTLLTRIAEAQIQAGDLPGARATLRAAAPGAKAAGGEALKAVARAGTAGDIAGARHWAAQQGSPANRTIALLGVAEGISSQPSTGTPAPVIPEK